VKKVSKSTDSVHKSLSCRRRQEQRSSPSDFFNSKHCTNSHEERFYPNPVSVNVSEVFLHTIGVSESPWLFRSPLPCSVPWHFHANGPSPAQWKSEKLQFGDLCNLKGWSEPLDKKIHEILGSKREDRFSNPFFEVVQKTCQDHFSYLLRLGNFCQGPRTPRKFPQKCQKIAGCWGRAVYVHNLQSPRHLAHPLRNDPVQTISRVNHGLTRRAPVTPLLVLCLALFNKKSVTKWK